MRNNAFMTGESSAGAGGIWNTLGYFISGWVIMCVGLLLIENTLRRGLPDGYKYSGGGFVLLAVCFWGQIISYIVAGTVSWLKWLIGHF